MATIPEFIGISLVSIITPGPDTALTVRNSIRGGSNAGLLSVAGIVIGQLCWASAASVGLQALFNTSQFLYTVLKYGGAMYLFYLGARSLYEAFRVATPSVRGSEQSEIRRSGRSPLREGLLSNLTNPKMLVFFSSLLPPFVHGTGFSVLPQFLTLGIIFSALTFGWLTFYILLIDRATAFVQQSGFRRIVNSVTGLALMGFALKVSTERG